MAGPLAGRRELVIPGLPYIAIYQVGKAEVVIVSFFHAAPQAGKTATVVEEIAW
jgi:hypothetical protein